MSGVSFIACSCCSVSASFPVLSVLESLCSLAAACSTVRILRSARSLRCCTLGLHLPFGSPPWVYGIVGIDIGRASCRIVCRSSFRLSISSASTPIAASSAFRDVFGLLDLVWFVAISRYSVRVESSCAIWQPMRSRNSAVNFCRSLGKAGTFSFGSLGSGAGSGPGLQNPIQVSGMVASNGSWSESPVVSRTLHFGELMVQRFPDVNMSSILLSLSGLLLRKVGCLAASCLLPVVCRLRSCMSCWCILSAVSSCPRLSSAYNAAFMSPATIWYGACSPCSAAVLLTACISCLIRAYSSCLFCMSVHGT